MPSIEGRVDDAFQQIAGRDGVVTATTNGQHKQGSLHGKGLAVDLRGRDLTDAQSKKVRDILKKNLGPDYDVLWETSPKNRDNNHIHVEYDPKNKPTGTSGERCP
jgi:conjugal transfer mating pair stabilization protein TraG